MLKKIQAKEPLEIPSSFYAHALYAIALSPYEIRLWSICNTVLQHMLKHFDPQQLGMHIAVFLCMPPRDSSVRSVCVCFSIGTSPWHRGFSEKILFQGRESFAGQVVATGRPAILLEEQGLTRIQDADAQSVAAAPFLRDGCVGGCLLIASACAMLQGQELDLLEKYADLLSVCLDNTAFYTPQRIKLCTLPSLEEQSPLLKTYPHRIAAILQESARQSEFVSIQPLNMRQAEGRARREIEELLLAQVTADQCR